MVESKITDNTLCWTCKKCYGNNQCNWAKFLKPIEGWKTSQGENEDEQTRSFDITSCPEYIKDDKEVKTKEVYGLLAMFFQISLTTAQTRWLHYSKLYQKQMIKTYGSPQQIPRDKRIPAWFWYKDIDRGM